MKVHYRNRLFIAGPSLLEFDIGCPACGRKTRWLADYAMLLRSARNAGDPSATTPSRWRPQI